MLSQPLPGERVHGEGSDGAHGRIWVPAEKEGRGSVSGTALPELFPVPLPRHSLGRAFKWVAATKKLWGLVSSLLCFLTRSLGTERWWLRTPSSPPWAQGLLCTLIQLGPQHRAWGTWGARAGVSGARAGWGQHSCSQHPAYQMRMVMTRTAARMKKAKIPRETRMAIFSRGSLRSGTGNCHGRGTPRTLALGEVLGPAPTPVPGLARDPQLYSLMGSGLGAGEGSSARLSRLASVVVPSLAVVARSARAAGLGISHPKVEVQSPKTRGSIAGRSKEGCLWGLGAQGCPWGAPGSSTLP